MNQTLQAGGRFSSCTCLPAPSTWMGLRAAGPAAAGERSGARGIRDGGGQRAPCAGTVCVRNRVIIYMHFAVCHKIMTEQMLGSSPRGLVQVLSMVLLSALSSEYFLTWLLNTLWAGTWHRAASAPKALVLLQTKCHCAWLRFASEEGVGTPVMTPLCGSLNSTSGGLGGQSCACAKLQTAGVCEDTGWTGGCFVLCRVQAVKLPLLEGPAQLLVMALLPARTGVGSQQESQPEFRTS